MKKKPRSLILDLTAAWGDSPLDESAVSEILIEALGKTIDEAVYDVMHSHDARLKTENKTNIIKNILNDYQK